MTIIDDELDEIRRCCENVIPDSKVVACVPAMIRVEIRKSDFKKVAVCLTYPVEYPKNHILVEVKSKTLARKLLDGLERVAENEAKTKHKDKPQVIPVLKFIRQFIDDNPLACCYEEVLVVKSLLNDGSTLKLSQKTSSMSLHILKDKYFFKCKIHVPNDYPDDSVFIDKVESNFPRVFKVWFAKQAEEIVRRCIMPPLKPKLSDPPFECKPSLKPAAAFLAENVQRYVNEICQKCKRKAFPDDPAEAVHNQHAAAHVERVYCSHVYHHDCLILYMKTPPFQGGKKCLACKQRIYHEKWKVTPELAEARWAHEQARNRELGDVVDFFADLTADS